MSNFDGVAGEANATGAEGVKSYAGSGCAASTGAAAKGS